MSHFSVGVICKNPADVDKLLAPYNEELDVKPYIGRTKAEMIADGKKHKAMYEEKPEEYTWFSDFAEAQSDDDFYNLEKQDYCEYDNDGNELSTYNPKSKWDWYSIGGRWGDELRLKEEDEDGCLYCDEAKIKDIDFSMNKERYDGCLQWWKDNIEAPDEEWKGLYKKEYYTERYKDAEEYATRNATFSTFALVTPDGEWHECGEMGWFGCSSETPEEARTWDEQYMSFIENADPEHYFVMVDCHI